MRTSTSCKQFLKKYIAQYLALLFIVLQLIPSSARSETKPIAHTTPPSIQYEGRNAFGLLTGKEDDGYDQYVDHKLGFALADEFPGIQAVLAKSTFYYTSPTAVDEIRDTQQHVTKLLIQVLSQSKSTPVERKPILLLASVRLVARLNTAELLDPTWQTYRPVLEKYGIVFKTDPVKGPIIYAPVLNDIWRKYPDSTWGQDAFVLDLKSAFGCDQGNQEYHTMIRLGDRYVRDHPDDPRNPWVNFVVAVAFEDWFAVAVYSDESGNRTLSEQDITIGISPAVRKSAIQYFLKTALGVPHSELSRSAAAAIKGLSSGLPPDEIAYACIAH